MTNHFNTVIEIPIHNINILLKRRNNLNLKLDDNHYFFVFNNSQLKLVQEMIINYNLKIIIEDINKNKETVRENMSELVNHVENKFKDINVDLSFCHEILEEDTKLRKKVIDLFIKQNKNLFLNYSKPISLLNGSKGVFTVRVTFLTYKNHEE